MRPSVLGLAALAWMFSGQAGLHADPPKIRELRTQKVGDVTYFQVLLDAPKDLRARSERGRFNWWNRTLDVEMTPQLVAQDPNAAFVYPLNLDWDVLQGQGFFQGNRPREDVPDPRVAGLAFVGKTHGAKDAKFLLMYPKELMTPRKAKKDEKENPQQNLKELLEQRGAAWGEETIALDWKQAKETPMPAAGFQRGRVDLPQVNDLEGRWALGQALFFAMMEERSPEFGYFGFAREATARVYKVPPGRDNRFPNNGDGDFLQRRAYELTTGTTAIAESLALNRMRGNFKENQEARTIDIAKVPGIEIAEHPWVKMMAGQKPSPEPLARLVPHDNYYLHFRDIGQALEIGDFLEKVGSTLTQAFDVAAKDHQLKERLEEQLCLRSTGLARRFGSAAVKSLAITGSDPYLREGSDVTVLFHLKSKELFQVGVGPVLQDTIKKWGKNLTTAKEKYADIEIESYTTALREVSLHRATFEDYIVYSNSPVGIRRVIDTYKGKLKPIWDSLDFQYMRTIFRVDDAAEDGFLFLSDPFIRNLVGPVTRIKERRRLEGLTSLYMVTHGALYCGHQTGKLPKNHDELLARTGLKQNELFSPEGLGAFWDADKHMAVSDVYNTVHFATPLIELPLDKVTATERREYEDFRQQYLGLWRQFFDPIGIRLGMKGGEFKVETYVLPLVLLTQYDQLRRLTGDGTVKLDAAMFSDKTIAQMFMHFSPKAEERRWLGDGLRAMNRDIPGLDWMGNWITLRLDDSPIYQKIFETYVRRELGLERNEEWREETRLFFQMPLMAGIEVRNPLIFAGVLAAAKKTITEILPGAVDWEPLKDPYKGVTFVEIKARPNGPLTPFLGAETQPAVYYALLDGGFYLSLQQEPLKDLVDRSVLRREGKLKIGEKVEINTALYMSPKAAEKAQGLLRMYAEFETNKRALNNAAYLYPLFKAGLFAEVNDPTAMKKLTMQYLGFVPTSPDHAPYAYDARTDEVVNKRHGSLRQPKLHLETAANAPVLGLLEQLKTIRADMRFREDGLHATVTIQQGKK